MCIFCKDFTAGPFELFSTSHLIALGLVAAWILFLVLGRKRFSPRTRDRLRWGMAVVLLLNEIAWHAWNAGVGKWNIQEMLPLHLCSILVWTSVYMLLTRSQFIYEVAYLLGIAGALQALLTPDLGIYDFPHFRYYQTFISHGLLIASALYLTVVEGMRPTVRSMGRVLLYGNLYAAVVFVINLLIGSNYMFIAHKPPTASILDALPPWPYYLLFIEGLGIAFMLIFYAPFAIMDWRAKRAARLHNEPAV